MTSTSIGERIESELGSIAERCGCELLDARLAGGVLRLILDHQEGVTLEHCERVSREASALLDVEDFADGRYVLEVSSPGLDREFYRDSDYLRFSGQRVRITWRDAATGNRRTDGGILGAPATDAAPVIRLETEQGTLEIPLSDIEKTRLDPDF